MPENIQTETKSELVKTGGRKDNLSQLFEERDRPNKKTRNAGAKDGQERGKGTNFLDKSLASPGQKPEQKPEPETAKGETAKPLQGKGSLDDSLEEPSSQKDLPQKDTSQPALSKAEALRVKLEKTEKVLAENQRYGRTNAQKLKLALKAVQKFADDGVLAEEEAQELFGVLQSSAPEGAGLAGTDRSGNEGEDGQPSYQAGLSQTSPFAPIFEIANKELHNIFKYTEDELLHDKVNAFDYFLSVGSKQEIDEVLEDLTALMDNPVQLARKMLSIGARVYEESYKGIREAGGFREYLAQKEETVEKMQKKIDKLEKKLLQYEDFDKPRYRIDEMGGDDAPGKGSPARDTISKLFEERDRRPQRRSGFRNQAAG